MTNQEKQEMLDELEKAYYEGVFEIQYNDKRVRYRSKEEMKQIIDELKIQLGISGKTSRYFAKFKKGTC